MVAFLVGLLTAFALTVFGSVLVTNLQMRLMEVAGDAQTIGAAMKHASLNIANALGAWLGGGVVSAGFGYPATSWVGAGLSLAGLIVLLVPAAVHRRTRPRTPPRPPCTGVSPSRGGGPPPTGRRRRCPHSCRPTTTC